MSESEDFIIYVSFHYFRAVLRASQQSVADSHTWSAAGERDLA